MQTFFHVHITGSILSSENEKPWLFVEIIRDELLPCYSVEKWSTRWWQLKHFSCSSRTLGKMNPIWTNTFQNGLKPPTSGYLLYIRDELLPSYIVEILISHEIRMPVIINQDSMECHKGF